MDEMASMFLEHQEEGELNELKELFFRQNV